MSQVAIAVDYSIPYRRPNLPALRALFKLTSVFLSGDFVKLGDFGLSKDMAGHTFTQTYVGTPLYMPPEILAENRYDTKSDIWSLGCLVYEMCALQWVTRALICLP